jgi:hypothetical protein
LEVVIRMTANRRREVSRDDRRPAATVSIVKLTTNIELLTFYFIDKLVSLL